MTVRTCGARLSSLRSWLKRKQLPAEYQPSRGIALALALPGLAAVAAYWIGLASGWTPSGQDRLSLLLNAGLLLFAAGCARLLGRRTLRAVAFPLAFLLFMVPLPSFLERAVESFLQHVSADAIYVLLQLSGTTVFRDGTLFVLPGVRLEVAPECCGIHSTLVLVITSLLAGELLLLRARTKILLLAGVILIGILRNAIRVWVLAQIAVHGNPGILDSDLHHRGGPLFFAASLVPCFLLIWFLRRLDLRAKPIAPRSTD
jgi:exosortase C (VPDSG-CTERM-specific)